MKQEHLFLEEKAFKILNDEYNLAFIDGRFGNGKTAFLSYIAYTMRYDYYRIYTNYHLNLPNAFYLEKINQDVLLDLNESWREGMQKSLMVLQESYNYFDKRYCMRKENKGIQTALFQIRKMGIDILADIPRLQYLDFRSLENGNIFIHAGGRLFMNEKKTNIFLYQLYDIMAFMPLIHFYIDMSEIFEKKIYDTFEKTKRQKEK